MKKWEKQEARDLARLAKANGFLVEPDNCEECGLSREQLESMIRGRSVRTHTLQMHHEDYGKPFDIVWLCIDCHTRRHRPR